MKQIKNLSKMLAAVFIFMLLSVLISASLSAEPYTDILIVSDNKTIIKATDFDSKDYKKAPSDGTKDIRPDEDVSTEVGGSEFGGNIGYIAIGDWTQYTTYVEKAGKYRISAWLASDGDSRGGLKLYVNDVEVGISEKTVKEGWQVYTLYFIADVDLAEGKNILKTEFRGSFNFSALEIVPLGSTGEPIWIPVEHRITTSGKNTVKAVDFDPGKYNKTPTEGSKDLRPDEEVNTEVGENEFGGNIAYITAGDWVQYTIYVNKDGKYLFEAWLASESESPGGVKFYCDDIEIGTSENSAANGWQAFDIYPVGETEINSGEHVIKAEFTGEVNFSAFKMTRTGNIGKADEESAPSENKDTPTTQTDSKTGESDGSGMMLIILLAVGAAIVIAVVVITVVRNNKKDSKKR